MRNISLVKKYFEEHSLIQSNIESFNNFIEKGMHDIIKEIGDIIPAIIPEEIQDFKIKLDEIQVGKPQIIEADGSKKDIYPIEARMRKITYSAPIFLKVSAHIDGVQRESFITQVGKLPIMVKSKYCHLSNLKREELIAKGEDPDDPGGYFILNGNERVLITVEDLVSNKMFVEKTNVGPSEYVGKVFSEMGAYRVPHLIELMKDGNIYLSFTRFKRIPIIVIIKALGLTKDRDIAESIASEKEYDEIFINLYNSMEVKTEEDAQEYVAKKLNFNQPKDVRLGKVKENFDKYLLPHLGTSPKDRLYKALNLCKLIKKYLIISKERIKIDKDHYMNKRLKLSGDLLGDLFRVNLRSLVNDLLYNFQRLVKRGKFNSVKIIIRDKLLTSRINSAMATGAWVGGRKGVSQNIDRTNFLASLSHLQRVVSLLSSTQENFEARGLHPTHYGRLCLSKNTNVLLADKKTTRTLEQLQNCWKHHNLITYNKDSKEFIQSSISTYFSSNPRLMNKKVFSIYSESGREIIATEDHPFLTQRGWMDAGKLNKTDLVAVYPMLETFKTPNPPSIENGEVIVDESIIKALYPKRYKHYIKELKERELLPFTVNNYWAEIIARLQAHLFTDGHCGKNNLEFYLGCLEDAEEVANEIKQLKFVPSKINKKVSKAKINGRETITTTYRFTKGGSLHALLVALGTPIGKKTNLSYSIPNWIKKAEMSVKREFLATYMGGDGGKPRCESAGLGKIKIEDLSFHKNIILKNDGLKFAEELSQLFTQFGINILRIDILPGYKRKDGSETIKIELVFAKSNKNSCNLLNKIGFRYCKQKNNNSLYIGEWLRLHEKAIQEKITLKKRIRKLYSEGRTPKEISNIISNVSYRMINSWLFERKYNHTNAGKTKLVSFNTWLEGATKNLEGTGLVWERITDKIETELDDVRDITTTENTHTFIANGFVTHNCPIETPEGTSIGLRKNLSLLCTITQEIIQEEKIKKSLENLGLKSK